MKAGSRSGIQNPRCAEDDAVIRSETAACTGRRDPGLSGKPRIRETQQGVKMYELSVK